MPNRVILSKQLCWGSIDNIPENDKNDEKNVIDCLNLSIEKSCFSREKIR